MDGAVSLPLADKEVVLTFDDGPVPRYSNQILDILAAQCVKATFSSSEKWLVRIP
jgi:peptidoglycan/xylan/chitin deacetylase (PgdA/CDA1 family)